MVVAEAAAGITSLCAALDIIRAMAGLRDTEAFRAKSIELQGVVLEAFEKAIEAREAHTQQAERIRGSQTCEADGLAAAGHGAHPGQAGHDTGPVLEAVTAHEDVLACAVGSFDDASARDLELALLQFARPRRDTFEMVCGNHDPVEPSFANARGIFMLHRTIDGLESTEPHLAGGEIRHPIVRCKTFLNIALPVLRTTRSIRLNAGRDQRTADEASKRTTRRRRRIG